MDIITNTDALKQICSQLETCSFITVDLEFLREKHYYAQLCLIQIGSKTSSYIIDPLSPDIKLQPFFDLMHNPNIIKVFHSGRQDIEIIYNLSGIIPYPLFDTQIAAMVCGY